MPHIETVRITESAVYCQALGLVGLQHHFVFQLLKRDIVDHPDDIRLWIFFFSDQALRNGAGGHVDAFHLDVGVSLPECVDDDLLKLLVRRGVEHQRSCFMCAGKPQKTGESCRQ